MSTTTDLTTLKINYLTQAQYDAEIQGGTVNENELYLTPSSQLDFGELSLDTSAQAGTTDGDLYAAINGLGWASDVIE